MTSTSPVSNPDNPNFGVNDLDATPEEAFRDYDLPDGLVEALEADGKPHPFPIQALTLPITLRRNDVIGQARTGTGKTLAFGLPLLAAVDTSLARTQALVVVPTRELCLQVLQDLRIGETLGITLQAVYGGVGYEAQTEALESGVHVVVGTPGRTLDMLNRGTLDLSQVQTVVLDEADEMLDMGFLPDVERLIEAAGTEVEQRHTMLFSATMPAEIVKLGRRYMHKPTFMRADTQEHETAPTVEQHFLQVYRMDKPRVLARILQTPERGNVYVFCRTKAMVDRLVRELEDLGVKSIAIHGDIRQASREKHLEQFRDGDVSVLVATEVAARGLDVDNVTHVINYDIPDDEKMYLHRIGRTARAGNKGVAVTFAEHQDVARASIIRKAVEHEGEIDEIFSTSDRLTELFDLPDERPWDHLTSVAKQGGGRSKQSDGGRSGKGGGRSQRSGGGSSSSRRDSAAPSRRSRDDSGRGSSSTDRGNDSSRSSRGSSDESRDSGRSSRGGSRSGRSGGSGSGQRERGDDRSSSTSSRDSDASRESDASRDRTKDTGSDDLQQMVEERARARRERRRNREQQGGQRESRTRDRDDSGDEGPKGGARDRSRRSRGRDGADRSGGGGRSSSGDSSDSGSRSRSGRQGGRSSRSSSSGGGSSKGDSSDDGPARGGGSSSQSRAGSRGGTSGSRNSGGRNSGGSSSRGNSGKGNSGGRSSGKGNSGGRGSGGRSSGTGRSESARSGTDPTIRTTSRGPEARGEGRPRLERRVEIEHLP